MVVIVMGASGAGKTTVGVALARSLGWRFIDADDLHPPANIEKMSRNEALTDADREPWLIAVRQTIVQSSNAAESLVVACSALKHGYRQTLSAGIDGIRFVYLKTTVAQLARRLSARPGHFAGPGLLASQLAAIEEPPEAEALILDASQSPAALVEHIRHAFDLGANA